MNLSEVLWRERHLLELLVFKLEEEQLIITSGRTRWLSHATREVENVLDEIRAADLGRAIEADEAAVMLGLEPGCSLNTLASAAPAPWDELLRAHRDAFCSLTAEIASLGAGNRDLLAISHKAAQEALAGLQKSVMTYDDSGQSAAQTAVAQLVDRAM
ncbi:MAG: flagellar protein FlgN [Micrococcales bacterium]|nr:flagellar protein FlgN [Micrococcales bacterium]